MSFSSFILAMLLSPSVGPVELSRQVSVSAVKHMPVMHSSPRYAQYVKKGVGEGVEVFHIHTFLSDLKTQRVNGHVVDGDSPSQVHKRIVEWARKGYGKRQKGFSQGKLKTIGKHSGHKAMFLVEVTGEQKFSIPGNPVVSELVTRSGRIVPDKMPKEPFRRQDHHIILSDRKRERHAYILVRVPTALLKDPATKRGVTRLLASLQVE